MKKTLRILHLEDKRFDADNVQRELKKSGLLFKFIWVSNKRDFKKNLTDFSPDIILSDHSLPSFTSVQALKLVRESGIDIPFILVTATMNDEAAVGFIKEGMSDYILKDRIHRLPTAVTNALERYKNEKEKHHSQIILIAARLSQAQQVAHIGSWELDFETGVGLWSDEICRIYGISIEENKQSYESWVAFIHPEDLDFVTKETERSRLALADSSFEHRIVWKDGTVRYIHSISKFEFDKGGKPKGLFGVCHDITEKRINEIQKEFDSNNLNALINNTSDLMWSVDTNFNLITSNQPFDEMSKANFGGIIEKGNSVLSVSYNEEMRNHFKSFYERAFEGELFTEIEHFDFPAELWTEISYYPIYKGNKIIGTACHSRDITQVKLAEMRLLNSETQIRNFAKHLNQIQEEEKAHIAREIHDEVGQQLVGIKISISSLKNKNSTPEEKENIKEMMAEVDNSLQSLRKISTDLRPGILDTLGLAASIEWLGKEFERKAGIKCEFKINVREQKFEKNISICFFRICQEALTNITKHAKADKVIITMTLNKKVLALTIVDNGKGITKEKLKNPFSMGLLGMRERASNIGGSIDITSNKKKGTAVDLKVTII